MLRLAEKYGHLPAAELPALFSTASCRTRSATGSGARGCARCGPRCFPRSAQATMTMTGRTPWKPPRRRRVQPAEAPAGALGAAQILEIIEEEISRLPLRQREAFVLRYWEELDVAETARAMNCSEGSVKTHCSRAAHAADPALAARGITFERKDERNAIRPQDPSNPESGNPRPSEGRGAPQSGPRGWRWQQRRSRRRLAGRTALVRFGGWGGFALRVLLPLAMVVASGVALYAEEPARRGAGRDRRARCSPTTCRSTPTSIAATRTG